MTQEQLAASIEVIMSNEDTAAEFLTSLNQMMPEDDEIKLAMMYHTNNEFKDWLNVDCWNRRA